MWSLVVTIVTCHHSVCSYALLSISTVLFSAECKSCIISNIRSTRQCTSLFIWIYTTHCPDQWQKLKTSVTLKNYYQHFQNVQILLNMFECLCFSFFRFVFFRFFYAGDVTTFFIAGVTGAKSSDSMGVGQGTPWTSRQLIAGHKGANCASGAISVSCSRILRHVAQSSPRDLNRQPFGH